MRTARLNLYGRLAVGNKSRTGQKRSPQEVEGARLRMIGNKFAVGNKNAVGRNVSIKERASTSRRMKGNTIRLGAKLSEETKLKISASQRRRLAMRLDQPSQT